jgi:16S rRNA (adenine1518-N6/adenine1519-N6)-dimethyltransferase
MPDPPSQNRTLSFLRERLRQAGVQPQKRLGQNFLVDLNLHDLIVRTAALGTDDVVLEVGTGTGSLTVAMAARAAEVVTIEVDPVLFALAGEQLHGLSNVHRLRADVLANKNRLTPAVLELVESRLHAATGRRLKLVANLPYHVATPVITNLLALDHPPVGMTVTIQKELAERIVARPGAKDYGALAIWVQSQSRAEIIRVMPPSVFWPRPKVDSAIVHIALDADRHGRIADRAFFHHFVRAVFLHRRKFLRSAMAAALKERLTKPQIDELLQRLGLSGAARAEQLEVSTVLALAEAVRVEVGS